MPVAAGGTARTAGKGGFELTVPDWEEKKKTDGESSRKTRTVRVPEGVDMWVPIYNLHRCRAVWGDDAEEFVPERFLDPAAPFAPGSPARGAAGDDDDGGGGGGAGSGSEAARRFLPFSLGARDCVGQALARTALIAELAALLGGFSFEVDREKMGGSLLPPKTSDEKVRGEVEGLGSTVIANEAMAVTLRVLGGVWLLARPRGAQKRGPAVGVGERES